MKKVLLVCVIALAFASFKSVNNQKTILKDIDGTLLESYVVVDDAEKTITFTVDANTTVSSSLIDGEFKIFLIENGDSNKTKEYKLTVEGNGNLSFDSYFGASLDVASLDMQATSLMLLKKKRPYRILAE